jgi:heat shock protein HslJ
MDQEYKMKKILFSIGLCAGLIILTACASASSPQGGASDLTGSVWSLSLLMDKAIIPGSSISSEFTSDGKVSGSSGCNQYSSTYTITGSTIKIATPMASTLMACSQELMDQESAYLKALGEAKTFSVAGDQLTLADADKKSLLVYKTQSQNLSGTSWEVIGYNNGKQAVTSVLSGSTIRLDFASDGTLSGNSGCNSYNGTFTVTGNQITIGPIASTRMACSQELMDQESLYLAALGTAATYQIKDTGLELRTKDGALAVDGVELTPSTSIQDIVWQWVSVTNQSTGETTTVPNPESYTITFNADGTMNGKADCNNFSGTYSQENGLIIKVETSTMAYCGDTSLDQQYLALLGNVVAGGPDGSGGLALENAGGEQRMLFKNGSASQ